VRVLWKWDVQGWVYTGNVQPSYLLYSVLRVHAHKQMSEAASNRLCIMS